MKPYRFSTRRPKGTPDRPPAMRSDKAFEMDYPGTSTPERWIYRALLELGYRPENIRIQQSVLGGRDRPGGFVSDIIVYKPHACLINPKGFWWHRNDEKEFYDDAVLAGMYPEVVIIWDYEAPTYEAMREIIRVRVGRPT